MKTLLRIDASSRVDASKSRELGNTFVENWKSENPEGEVVVRDLISANIPHISEETIGGFYTPTDALTTEQKSAIRLSDELISELQSASELLICVPMYNFSMPSCLKAWIDQIVRMNETFAYDGTNFTGLATTKKAHIICVYGASGFANEGPLSAIDFLEPYLTHILKFIGIGEVSSLMLEGTSADEESVARSVDAAKEKVNELFSQEAEEVLA